MKKNKKRKRCSKCKRLFPKKSKRRGRTDVNARVKGWTVAKARAWALEHIS